MFPLSLKMHKHFRGSVMPESHRARSPAKAAAAKPASPFAEFLNPNSMITPGAAGAFTMVITNTLCQQFEQLLPNYTGLAVSLMFGAVVFGYGASLVTRAMYFVINSLIIFVVANGSNAIGVRINEGSPAKTASLESTSTPVAGNSGAYSVASADVKPADKSNEPPPAKPKFFRRW